MPLVEELRTTKQPSLSSPLSSDSARCRDISPTYHLRNMKLSLEIKNNKNSEKCPAPLISGYLL